MADAPYKSSPSGLRSVKQSVEVRTKVRALTERIAKGSPIAMAPAPAVAHEEEDEAVAAAADKPKEK